MCGRFRLPGDDDFDSELAGIMQKVKERYPDSKIKYGDIYPTDTAPVLVNKNSEISPVPVKWGFKGYKGSRVLINARAETVREKAAFKDSFLNRRCVVLSSGYYEWDRDKQKYFHTVPDSDILYMAGLWNVSGGEPRFVIITANANKSASVIHDRMPVVIRRDKIQDWIYDTGSAEDILRTVPPELEIKSV